MSVLEGMGKGTLKGKSVLSEGQHALPALHFHVVPSKFPESHPGPPLGF